MALDSDGWPQAWLIRTNIGDGDDGNTNFEGDDDDADDDDTWKGMALSHCHSFVSDLHKGVALSTSNGQ